jgi:hypothetical protein
MMMFGSVERKEMACSSLEIRNCDSNQLFVSENKAKDGRRI